MKIFCVYVCVSECVFVHHVQESTKTRKGIGSPGTGVTAGFNAHVCTGD